MWWSLCHRLCPPYKVVPLLLLPARNARFLEVKLALDLAAGLVGDLALAQELVDVLAFRRDQVHTHVGAEPGGIPALIDGPRKLLTARLVPRARQCEHVVR